jgi:hypothetical protein
LDPEACLKDKRGIAFHGIVLFLTRLFLGVSDNIHAQNWWITTIAAGCSLLYNVMYWPWDIKNNAIVNDNEILKLQSEKSIELQPYSPTPQKDGNSEKAYLRDTISSPSGADDLQVEVQNAEVASPSQQKEMTFVIDADDVAKMNAKQLEEAADSTLKKFQSMTEDPDAIKVEEPTVKASILNCPWAVLPFVFGMFTIVNALKLAGWIDALAEAILNVIPADQGNSGTAIATSTFLMATILLFCVL